VAKKKRKTRSDKGKKRKKSSNPSNPKGGGSGKQNRSIAGRISRASRNTGNFLFAYGAVNPPATVLLGRNGLHPLGGLDSGSVFSDGTIVLAEPVTRGPFKAGGTSGVGTRRVMIDVAGLPFDTANWNSLKASAANRGLKVTNPLVNGVRQNASNAFFTPEGRRTAFGPFLVGFLAKAADTILVPVAVDAIKGGERIAKDFGKSLRTGFA